MFWVGRATVKRYLALRRQTVALAPCPRHGPPPIKTAPLAAELPARLEVAPDATFAVRVSGPTMSRFIARFGRTRKRKP